MYPKLIFIQRNIHSFFLDLLPFHSEKDKVQRKKTKEMNPLYHNFTYKP